MRKMRIVFMAMFLAMISAVCASAAQSPDVVYDEKWDNKIINVPSGDSVLWVEYTPSSDRIVYPRLYDWGEGTNIVVGKEGIYNSEGVSVKKSTDIQGYYALKKGVKYMFKLTCSNDGKAGQGDLHIFKLDAPLIELGKTADMDFSELQLAEGEYGYEVAYFTFVPDTSGYFNIKYNVSGSRDGFCNIWFEAVNGEQIMYNGSSALNRSVEYPAGSFTKGKKYLVTVIMDSIDGKMGQFSISRLNFNSYSRVADAKVLKVDTTYNLKYRYIDGLEDERSLQYFYFTPPTDSDYEVIVESKGRAYEVSAGPGNEFDDFKDTFIHTFNPNMKGEKILISGAAAKDTDYTIKVRKHTHKYVIDESSKNSSYVTVGCYCVTPTYVGRTKLNTKLSTSTYTYSGKAKKPTVKVTTDKKGKTIYSKCYQVTYPAGRIEVGSYKVKVTFLYGGKNLKPVTKTFKIVPKKTSISSISSLNNGFRVKWYSQREQTTGYQIRYSRYSSMSNATIKTISSIDTLSKSVTSLRDKRKYYVQVRTYKTVDGVKYCSGWSTKKAITTR